MVVHAHDPSTPRIEARGSKVLGHPELHRRHCVREKERERERETELYRF
jgi:hypothetical protein